MKRCNIHLISQLANLLLVSALLALAASCVDDYEPTLKDENTEVLVIDGNINSNNLCVFTLSRAMPMTTGEHPLAHYINNATLSIHGSNGTTLRATPNGYAGIYKVNIPPLLPNVTYWLEVTWDGRTYQTTPLAPTPTPEIQDVEMHYRAEEGRQDVLVTTPPTATTQFASWDYDEAWEVVTPYRATAVYDLTGDSVRQIEPTDPVTNHGWCVRAAQVIADATKGESYYGNRLVHFPMLSIACSDDRLRTRYYICLRQTAITEAEYEYLRLREELSKDPNAGMGGLFAPQPSELPSNIQCTSHSGYRAIGYVGVHGAPAIYEKYFTGGVQCHYINKRIPTILYPEDTKGMMYRDLYKALYLPLFLDEKTYEVTWIQDWGVDARRWGAQLTKPSFWKN